MKWEMVPQWAACLTIRRIDYMSVLIFFFKRIMPESSWFIVIIMFKLSFKLIILYIHLNLYFTGRYGYFWFSASVKPKYCWLRLIRTLANYCAGGSSFLPESRVPVPQFVVRNTAPITYFQCSCSLKILIYFYYCDRRQSDKFRAYVVYIFIYFKWEPSET